MELSRIIDEKLIRLDMETRTKDEMLQQLCEMLYEEQYIENVSDFLKDVYLREEEGQTGLGNHIAIPHGKSKSVVKTSIAIGKSKYDLAWESLDDQPVKVVILFAVKESDKTTKHLKMLSQVAVTLADDGVLEGLLTSKDAESIVNLLTKQSA
jgi:PTS system fructose-specific IIA component